MKISVQVKTNSSQGDKVTENADGSYIIYLKKRPINGQANKSLLEVLSKHFSTPKTQIKILRGKTSRNKIIQIGQD